MVIVMIKSMGGVHDKHPFTEEPSDKETLTYGFEVEVGEVTLFP